VDKPQLVELAAGCLPPLLELEPDVLELSDFALPESLEALELDAPLAPLRLSLRESVR